MSATLRVLPLGGVGEIGKNMTVVEYEGRMVIVDCGLRFPTAEMMGIDLVLPDFSYVRDNIEQLEAIVITHGHEDHLGALPWMIRDLGQEKIPVVYSGQLTIAMARSKLDEHKLRDVPLEVLPIGDTVNAGPFEIERIHLTHSIPDSSGIALKTPLGTVLFTGDYKFDQTPVGGAPADMARLAELGREGVLLLCGDSTNVDRAGVSDSESIVGPHLDRVFARCQRPDRRHLLRVEHPPRPAGRPRGRRRTAARSRWSAVRCARTSTSAAASGTSTSRRGCSSRRARSTSSPTRRS